MEQQTNQAKKAYLFGLIVNDLFAEGTRDSSKPLRYLIKIAESVTVKMWVHMIMQHCIFTKEVA